MAEHTHQKGELMTSYRYMFMNMQQLMDGDSRVSDYDTDAVMVPTEMDMEMHMFGLMYAVDDKLTLMAMTNYLRNSMEMEASKGMMAGSRSKMVSEGWGDSSLGALYQFHADRNQRAVVGLSVSFPTGSTAETFTTPMGVKAHQPFPMQLGTGTYDLLPSISYVNQTSDIWSWGAQAKGRIHLDDNNQGFSYGDRIETTGWASRLLSNWASVSLRLSASSWSGIDGDTDLSVNRMNPNMSLPANPDNHGGSSIDAAIGLNLLHPHNGFRVAVELSKPLYQHLRGPQLAEDWSLILGAQFVW